jgi:hypothetical protein
MSWKCRHDQACWRYLCLYAYDLAGACSSDTPNLVAVSGHSDLLERRIGVVGVAWLSATTLSDREPLNMDILEALLREVVLALTDKGVWGDIWTRSINLHIDSDIV